MAPYSTSMKFPTTVVIVNSVGLSLSFLTIILRFWVRNNRNIKWRLCDYTIIISWLFTFGLVVSENYCVTRGGIGQNSETVGAEELLFAAKQFVVIGVTGSLAVSFVKISILDFFLSIFSTHNRFRAAAWVLIIITACYGVSLTITTLAACRPFEANWDKISYPDYQCINTSHFYVAQAAIGAFLDISVLILPVGLVWGLALKTSKKVGLTFLFTIGILVCGISLTRLVYDTREDYMLTHFSEYAGIAALLGALEANLSIICACLPIVPSLMSSLIERFRSFPRSAAGPWRWGRFSSYLFGNRRTPKPISDSSSLQRNLRDYASAEDRDLESAKLQKQHDKLYPLSITAATQISLDDIETGWLDPINARQPSDNLTEAYPRR